VLPTLLPHQKSQLQLLRKPAQLLRSNVHRFNSN
jgi:hypothetical protein